ncbi:deoxycytidylate deaminase [Mycoplasmopsis alligatoris]|uniref:Cytidine and deoxycytidylate deaminase zinc-binding region n=1 Tax=Mycoplasmopsis alligatoris A21JP2 TaxID=747682 RepID=D4XWF3_9BACT|nr:dCMP deaminase family protein [Mycoplasmopsis alligatoris]EFF41283.1 cytidine and deoxycytidylate deaminase zinc-binding region [Mycoplasmopsis alligatoris A21JP2]
MTKRINWDTYFISLAKISALRSKDPSTQVGACIINDEKKVIGLGYNGMPNGNDIDFPWGRDSKIAKETKYPYVVHAEVNAILNAIVQPKGAIIYTTLYPCINCAKVIVQSGIKEVVFEDDKYKDTEDGEMARYLFEKCNIKTRKLTTSAKIILEQIPN